MSNNNSLKSSGTTVTESMAVSGMPMPVPDAEFQLLLTQAAASAARHGHRATVRLPVANLRDASVAPLNEAQLKQLIEVHEECPHLVIMVSGGGANGWQHSLADGRQRHASLMKTGVAWTMVDVHFVTGDVDDAAAEFAGKSVFLRRRGTDYDIYRAVAALPNLSPEDVAKRLGFVTAKKVIIVRGILALPPSVLVEIAAKPKIYTFRFLRFAAPHFDRALKGNAALNELNHLLLKYRAHLQTERAPKARSSGADSHSEVTAPAEKSADIWPRSAATSTAACGDSASVVRALLEGKVPRHLLEAAVSAVEALSGVSEPGPADANGAAALPVTEVTVEKDRVRARSRPSVSATASSEASAGAKSSTASVGYPGPAVGGGGVYGIRNLLATIKEREDPEERTYLLARLVEYLISNFDGPWPSHVGANLSSGEAEKSLTF